MGADDQPPKSIIEIMSRKLSTQGIYNPTKTFTISHKSFKVNICNGVIGNCLQYLHSDKAQNDMTS